MREGWKNIEIDKVVLRTKLIDPTKEPEKYFYYVDVSSVSNVLFKIEAPNYITGKEAPSRARKLIQTDDIIFATVRPTLKRIAIVPQMLDGQICSTGYCVLKADKNYVDPLFLYFSLLPDSFMEKIQKLQRGASYPAIRDYDLKSQKILLPQLSEQRKISYILSSIQKAIEQQDKLIRHTTELKKALMQKLFTEGICLNHDLPDEHDEHDLKKSGNQGNPKNQGSDNKRKQKMTEIGLVPESWEVQPFENTGDVVYGIQAAVANNLKPIGHKILTNKNITIEGKLKLEKINYFKLTSKRHFDTILRKGDLLFNWRSGSKEHVGKTAIFDLEDAEYVHSSFILRIRVNKNHNAKFLFYYLNFLREIGYYQKVQTFSINAKFNKSAINAMPIALPKKNIQDLIAETIEAVDNKIDNQVSIYNLKTSLFKTLLHELMTGERRVNEIEV